MLSKCKWNGDPRPYKKDGPLPKGDPRDKINSHIRSRAKEDIQAEIRDWNTHPTLDELEQMEFWDRELA
jgi:hypothetical protein